MVLLSQLRPDKQLLRQALEATSTENSLFLSRGVDGRVPSSKRSLFVLQGEKALAEQSMFDFVGSEDATTCVIIVIIGNDHVFVTHVDDHSCRAPLSDEVNACTDNGKVQAKVYLAGCYVGGATTTVLTNLIRTGHGEMLDLVLCCCSRANLASNGFPLTRSLVVDKEGVPYPWTFEYRGPEIYRRHASRSFLRNEDGLEQVMNDNGELVLAPFTLNVTAVEIEHYKQMISLAKTDPKRFLASCSTSPEHESDLFVPDMIGMFEFIIEKGGKTVPMMVFTMEANQWVLKYHVMIK